MLIVLDGLVSGWILVRFLCKSFKFMMSSVVNTKLKDTNHKNFKVFNSENIKMNSWYSIKHSIGFQLKIPQSQKPK